MTFGNKLRAYREEHGMSQERLAQILGTTKQVISRYETGCRSPKIDVAQDYAKKLNLPISYLIDDNVVSTDGLDLTDPTVKKSIGRYISKDEFGTPILSFDGLVNSSNAEHVFERETKEYEKRIAALQQLDRKPLSIEEIQLILQFRKSQVMRYVIDLFMEVPEDKQKMVFDMIEVAIKNK